MIGHKARWNRSLILVCGAMAALLVAGCELEPADTTHTLSTTASVQARPATRPAPVTVSAVTAMPATVPLPAPAPVTVHPEPSAAAAVLAVDAALPTYRAGQIVSGPLRSVGSDSMDRVMQLWEAEFKKTHAEIALRHEGKGSGTAMPALMKGLSDLGPMSRPVTADEVASFNQRFDHPPTQVRVAVDALAVLVHPSNPIARTGLSFQQLDAIFSSTRKRGGSEDVVTWGQLGLTGQWADAPITVYTRNKASGTYAFFRDHVLDKGVYKATNQELPSSDEVIKAVESNPFAIGFSSVGYVTPDVAAVPLSAAAGKSPISPSRETAYANQYPLARYFYLTVNCGKDQPLAPQVQEFVRFVLSRDGQNLVVKEGLFPVTAPLAQEELTKVGLNR